MNVRYENESILADFNYRGWNPNVLVEDVTQKVYNLFIERCEDEYYIEDMSLTQAIEVLMQMAREGIMYNER